MIRVMPENDFEYIRRAWRAQASSWCAYSPGVYIWLSGPDTGIYSSQIPYQFHGMSVSGRSEVSGVNGKMLEVEKGSTPELKFCARTSFRREALSILAEIMLIEELFTVGNWDVSNFPHCLTVFQNPFVALRCKHSFFVMALVCQCAHNLCVNCAQCIFQSFIYSSVFKIFVATTTVENI